ncbi:hypothetical protein NA57DRAFT_80035 [Rhizodiscina lignyota]|uniref:BTB domain-containing protein n=1 Tax=Rhizodiscina lignyota TaxID=1504668 RepID=A0A9P4I4K4_9PEZI|nr:hypothetical protein NA57DRAFT_80035 [Rhizodiscina lignyota]
MPSRRLKFIAKGRLVEYHTSNRDAPFEFNPDEAMMQFLYEGEYHPPASVDLVGFHAAMFALGHQYLIKDLMAYALKEYKVVFKRYDHNLLRVLKQAPTIYGLLLEDDSLKSSLSQQTAIDFPHILSALWSKPDLLQFAQ